MPECFPPAPSLAGVQPVFFCYSDSCNLLYQRLLWDLQVISNTSIF